MGGCRPVNPLSDRHPSRAISRRFTNGRTRANTVVARFLSTNPLLKLRAQPRNAAPAPLASMCVARSPPGNIAAFYPQSASRLIPPRKAQEPGIFPDFAKTCGSAFDAFNRLKRAIRTVGQGEIGENLKQISAMMREVEEIVDLVMDSSRRSARYESKALKDRRRMFDLLTDAALSPEVKDS